MIVQRPIFDFSDPFKLNWLQKKSPVIVYSSVAVCQTYPKYILAGFVLSWRLSHFLPAPLQPLLEYLSTINFSVPSDSTFIKFKKFNF
jgi:hypothetical protein